MTSEELAKRDFRCMTLSILTHTVLSRIDPTDPEIIKREPELKDVKKRANAGFAVMRAMNPEKVDRLTEDVKEFIDHELPVMLVEELSALLNELDMS